MIGCINNIKMGDLHFNVFSNNNSVILGLLRLIMKGHACNVTPFT